MHRDSPHIAVDGTSNSAWASRVHTPAVLSVGEVLVLSQPPQIGCSDDLCEAVDPRGAEAGRFQISFFDHFLSAAATATSQVGRGYAKDGDGVFVSTLAACINTHALTHVHVCTQTLETQSYSTHIA